jgi:hypothetical protein
MEPELSIAVANDAISVCAVAADSMDAQEI